MKLFLVRTIQFSTRRFVLDQSFQSLYSIEQLAGTTSICNILVILPQYTVQKYQKPQIIPS